MAYDRRIILQRKGVVEDAWGGEEEGFEDLETVWAEFEPSGDSEKFQAGQVEATSMGWFRVRYSEAAASLKARDRVTEDGKPWKITGIKIIGRRRKIEFTVISSDATGG